MDWMKLFVIGNHDDVETLYRTRGLDRFVQRSADTNEYSARDWLDDTLIRHEYGLYCDGSWDQRFGPFFREIFAAVAAGDLGVVVAVHVIHMHDTEHCHSCVNHVAAAGCYLVEEFVREDYVSDSDASEDTSRDRMLAEAEFKYDKHILKALSSLH
ncbi:MAG: hypothetical protein WCO00_12705 [Rhodospirillaceae bacterium]